MAKTPRPWTVIPHGPLEQLEDNLWVVESPVPGPSGLDRRMSIVRLSDGRLLFHNAVPLDEPTLDKVRALGRPALLVVPNGFHRLDVHAFRERLGLAVYCPALGDARVREVVTVDGNYDALPPDPAYRIAPLAGTRSGEAVFVVNSGPGGARRSLLFCDAYMNIQRGGWFPRLIGSSGGPKVTPLFRLVAVSDRAALRADLQRLLDIPGVVRLVPSHGVISERDPIGDLRAAVATI